MNWYAIIPSVVLSSKVVSSSGKLLLGVIISLSNKTGYCFASNKYLSEILGVSVVYIRALLKELEEKNFIIRDLNNFNDDEKAQRVIRIADLELLKKGSKLKMDDAIVSGGCYSAIRGGDTIVAPNNKENNKENKKDNIMSAKKTDDSRFDEFWELYGKKVGKVKAINNWSKLKAEDKEACLLAIPKYKEARPNPIYRKDPERFIIHRVWEDEIIIFNDHKNPIKKNETGIAQDFDIKIPDVW